MDGIYAVKSIIAIAVWVAVIVVVMGCPKTKGRTWLLWFAGLSLGAAVGFVGVGPYLFAYFGRFSIIGTSIYAVLNLVSLAPLAGIHAGTD